MWESEDEDAELKELANLLEFDDNEVEGDINDAHEAGGWRDTKLTESEEEDNSEVSGSILRFLLSYTSDDRVAETSAARSYEEDGIGQTADLSAEEALQAEALANEHEIGLEADDSAAEALEGEALAMRMADMSAVEALQIEALAEQMNSVGLYKCEASSVEISAIRVSRAKEQNGTLRYVPAPQGHHRGTIARGA
eukprot:SAG11_NODE_1304_length_5250_cov_5.457581_1_plen_196_part_00